MPKLNMSKGFFFPSCSQHFAALKIATAQTMVPVEMANVIVCKDMVDLIVQVKTIY